MMAHGWLVSETCADILLALAVWVVLASGRLHLGVTAFAALAAAWTIGFALSGHLSPVLALAASVAAVSAVAYVLGFAFARFDTTRFTVATLLLGFIASYVAPSGRLSTHAGSVAAWSTWSPAVVLVVAVLLWRLLRSRDGRAMRAAASDEPAAEAAGIDTVRVRHTAFTVSAAFAALAGSLAAGQIAEAPTGFVPDLAAVAAAVIGGAGQVLGTIVVSLAFAVLRAYDHTAAVFGLVIACALLIAAIVAPAGLSSIFDPIRRRRRQERPSP